MSGREGWQVCVWCKEPVGEDSGMLLNGVTHRECALRMVVGGLNHLRGTCTCCGGEDEPDPPGLTRREAALLAAIYWEARREVFTKAARDTCREFGVDWIDPAAGQRHSPP